MKKKEMQEKFKRHKRRYLVGWLSRGQCVYGRRTFSEIDFTDPMSLSEAQSKAKELSNLDHDRVVFELVPVERVED